MGEENTFLNILIAEMPIQLPCTTPGCDHGDGGAAYKTPALDFADAVQILDRHRADAHGVHPAGGAGPGGGVKKIHMEKIPRPELSGGSSQEDFRQFKQQWDRYVRASNETDEVRLRDQLLQCPDTDLKKAVHRALGARVENITMVNLLREIETLAVVKQSNHVNILAMIKSKQERDEPVRQFAARIRGLAAVCDLATQCTCGLSVSMVDKWVLMTLINGLHDGDTQQAVLSKVEEMSLEDTIIFVEAREVGKQSVKVLSGGLSSGQVHRVNPDQGKCKHCGKPGHGKNPNHDIRKTDCPAFGKMCKKCKQKGQCGDVSEEGDSWGRFYQGHIKDDSRSQRSEHQRCEDVREVEKEQCVQSITDHTELD